MKIRKVVVTPQEGETVTDAIVRSIKNLVDGISLPKSESSNPVDQAPEEEDNCQCNVCQLRRELESSLKSQGEISPSKMNEEGTGGVFLDEQFYNFSQILEAMRNGYRVVRGDWPAVLSLALLNEKPTATGEGYMSAPTHIAQFYSGEDKPEDAYYLTPYNFTQEDILATDWKILKYKI